MSKLHFSRVAAGALLAFTLGVPSLSFAAAVDPPIAESAVIHDGFGSARILLKIGQQLPPPGSLVSRATLRVPLSGLVSAKTIRASLHPVTRAWNARSVSWSSGWSRPGGDFNDELFAEVEADLGRNDALTFDVTHLIKEIVEEGVFADGFILTVHPGDGIGYSEEDAARFQGISGATLDVRSRIIGVRSRGRAPQ